MKRWRAAAALLVPWLLSACQSLSLRPEPVSGIVWQIDAQTLAPQGSWDRLGARTLLVQWIAVDHLSYVKGGPWPQAKRLPDWQGIARQPWARDVILGLAGRSDEAAARADVAQLIEVSEKLARLPTPLNVVGWYFPVEIDPTWAEAATLGPLLAQLPRPLWISVYDSANVGPEVLLQGLTKWLPPDVGVFFQDGVGVHARDAKVARHYADVLSARLGKDRVRLVAEAFRPQAGGGFRSATIQEVGPQLALYSGYRIYLFDGPPYVNAALVDQVVAGQAIPGSAASATR